MYFTCCSVSIDIFSHIYYVISLCGRRPRRGHGDPLFLHALDDLLGVGIAAFGQSGGIAGQPLKLLALAQAFLNLRLLRCPGGLQPAALGNLRGHLETEPEGEGDDAEETRELGRGSPVILGCRVFLGGGGRVAHFTAGGCVGFTVMPWRVRRSWICSSLLLRAALPRSCKRAASTCPNCTVALMKFCRPMTSASIA